MLMLVWGVIVIVFLYLWLSGYWLGWMAAFYGFGYLALYRITPTNGDTSAMVCIAFVITIGTGLPFMLRSSLKAKPAPRK